MQPDIDSLAPSAAILENRLTSNKGRGKAAAQLKAINVSAPGRICLFGEHQDYLGLPIIAAAIELRVELSATKNPERRLRVELVDIDETMELDLDEQLVYRHERDYLPAAVNVLRNSGLQWNSGWDIVIQSTIPLNAGASSSSALQVAWCAFLIAAAGETVLASDPLSVALAAHQSEVTEFRAPGGMMDHFSSAYGGLIWFDPSSKRVERLNPWPGEFVLVNSGIPKDTNGLLGTVRKRVEKLGLGKAGHDGAHTDLMDAADRVAYAATIKNTMLTASARELLEQTNDHAKLGELLSEHHQELIKLGVSHPEIDRLLRLAAGSGGLGGKINGSGGGGSFFVLSPGCGEQVQRLYESQGLHATVVKIGAGVSVDLDHIPGSPA